MLTRPRGFIVCTVYAPNRFGSSTEERIINPVDIAEVSGVRPENFASPNDHVCAIVRQHNGAELHVFSGYFWSYDYDRFAVDMATAMAEQHEDRRYDK